MKSKNKHRSLEAFINELLDVTNTRSKKERTLLELYNIKQTFYSSRSNIFSIRNAMLRLAYIAMVGNSVDFGLDKIILLLNSKKFHIIQIGWLAFVIFNITDEISLRQIIQILQQQLLSYDNEPIQCLALSVVSQVFSKMILDVVGPEVAQIAVSPKTTEFARKKALIISAKIYQITREPHLISVLAPALSVYLSYGSYSIRMATATLTVNLMSLQPGAFSDVFDKVLNQLYQLYNQSIFIGNNDDTSADTIINEDYEGTPSPWYSRQLIRILRYKATWNFEELSKIDSVAMSLFSRTGEKLSIRPALSYFIVFSEMVSLLSMIPIPDHTITRCATTLVRYLENDRKIMIYFGLDSLNQLLRTNPQIATSIESCRSTLYKLIHSDDSQVCTNSLNLLVNLSTPDNSKEIVEKLMQFLLSSPLSIRKLLCSLISMLARKSNDPIFYIDTIVELLFEDGDECDDSVWQAAVSLVDTNEELRNHTIDLTLSIMKKTLRPSEQLMKLTVYVAGEFASEKVGSIVSFIIARYALQTPIVQAMMVTAMAKISFRFPDYLHQCQKFLMHCTGSPLTEVSDRAKQYSMMLAVMPFQAHLVMKKMPAEMGEDVLRKMLDTVHRVARGDVDGVSTFSFDDSEANSMPIESNEQLIQTFLLIGSGYVYHDSFLRVRLGIDYNPPLATAMLSFENVELLPLTEITVQIETNEDILYKSSPIPSIIEQRSIVDFKIDFLINNVTSIFPKLNVCFKCGGIDHLSEVFIPLSFSRVIQQVQLDSQSFQSQWMAIAKKELMAELYLPILASEQGENYKNENENEEEEEEEHIDNDNNNNCVESVEMAQINLFLKNKIGIELSNDIVLPNGLLGGCGIYKTRTKTAALFVVIDYNKKKNPNFAVVRIKSNSERAIKVAVNLMMPEQQQDLNQMQQIQQMQMEQTKIDMNLLL